VKLDVTRDVVSDIWPLYQAGEASADSRALIETFLSEDDPFASVLKKIEKPHRVMPGLQLSPDAERRLLDEARNRARMKLLVVGGGVALGGLILLIALGGALFLAVRAI
jgi:hypothetical protein